ncbi:MAG: hypothetical protein U0521_19655 [Anaerolineae bacterium]
MANNTLLPFEELGIERLNQQQISAVAGLVHELAVSNSGVIAAHVDDQTAQIILFVPDAGAKGLACPRPARAVFAQGAASAGGGLRPARSTSCRSAARRDRAV